MTTRRRLVTMQVAHLTSDPVTNMPIVVLKDATGKEAMPMWVGLPEAGAIAAELEGVVLERPMTHDLLKNALTALGSAIEHVEVDDVQDGTFYATIYLKQRGKKVALDARPSDAIALALRAGVPIRVSRRVIECSRYINFSELDDAGPSRAVASSPPESERGARRTMEGKVAKGDSRDEGEQLLEILASLSDEEFGKWKM